MSATLTTCVRGIAASMLSDALDKRVIRCTHASCTAPAAWSYGSAHYCERHKESAPQQHQASMYPTDPTGTSKALQKLFDQVLEI